MNPNDLTKLAHTLADASGTVIRKYFRTPFDVEDKRDSSPVTIADREAETVLRELVRGSAPGHGVIGEEFGHDNADAEFVWIFDPIDGTRAFITGRPIFGTLIALMHQGRFVMGVINQPIIGDRWIGCAGEPTLFNGKPARTRSCPELAAARLSTTGPQYFSEPKLKRFQRVVAGAKFMTYGGDCYQYGLVAIGGLDVVVETKLKLHDYAALVPIISGAGGAITDWRGNSLTRESDGDVVASGDARTHQHVLRALVAA